ncbi:carotenoid cleavage dioxygenase [Coniophora puteana RWD-64-598 SS2]|uniref:Carotenoid cleavage dioxygenase n=1 Tax=Coniophora puteana (strain RWD-64-598) TaxID=741705 RepID=R7SFL1_CONPW|nr:carotenoid cleavage dioxygenase [Coniophora puteana RWD-64-598 SS2]EIW74527.1 carotenoid cleavage dioxygenase [Coniophora puteana RWD-64-598 SS2]
MPEPYNNWPNDAGFDLDVTDDQREPVEAKITGTIPPYVAGVLYRTGPGGYRVPTDKGTTFELDHWFDGFTQNHRFEIIPATSTSPARVLYNSRMATDPLIQKIRREGKMDAYSFANKRDPCTGFFRKVMSVFFPPTSNYDEKNTGVTFSVNPPGMHDTVGVSPKHKEKDGHGIARLWTKTDAQHFLEIDSQTLEPIGYADQDVLHPDLKGPHSAAHAKSDPVTGDVFNYNLDTGKVATYRVFRVNASSGTTDIIATITDAPPAYLHSSLLTENFYILCVWNSELAWGGAKMLWDRNVLDVIQPDEKRGATWYVVDRRHGKGVVAKFHSGPFFSFHPFNAWEEPSKTKAGEVDIVADLPIYPNTDILKRLYYNTLKSTSPDALKWTGAAREGTLALLRRYRLPSVPVVSPAFDSPSTEALSAGTQEAIVEWTAPSDKSCDLPTLNPRYVCKPARYVYGVNDRGQSTFYDGLVKFDTHTQEAVYWSAQAQSAGEAVFVPNPDGTEEDDGALLTVVLDGFTGKSYLAVLDARDMTEVARASLETAVGFGFHGAYVAGKTGTAVDI